MNLRGGAVIGLVALLLAPVVCRAQSQSAADLAQGKILVSPRDSPEDRKSTRLNSSHPSISYAVFCLKKKNLPTPYRSIRTRQPRAPDNRGSLPSPSARCPSSQSACRSRFLSCQTSIRDK